MPHPYVCSRDFYAPFLLSSPVRTLNPEEADWFYTPVYATCDLTPNGLPLPFKSPRMMRSAIQLISSNWPYWNATEGADHFFIVPHDFAACFHYLEEKAIERGILPLLQRATLVQTFGQRNHIHLCYFRGLFYDVGNDPEGGYYARGARASVWENFKDNPLFDISTEHPTTYYEDMQRAIFCLCPLGWAPWSPRLVEAVVFGCIPVIIADDIVLPFADAIPWEEILAMLFPHPAQARDAFHQILNGLARKLPHDRSIYLRSGESILNWTAGPTSVRNGHKSSWSQVHGATISAAGSYHRPLCAVKSPFFSPSVHLFMPSQLSTLPTTAPKFSRCVLLPSKPTSAAIAGISTMTEHLLRNWLITILPLAGIALRNSTWSGSIDCPIFLPQHPHLR
ncbi:hypothetical protein SASPL_157706 [Salvia splendens]|uniref:Exostosin GT47 domain-containing protein n=1 Tax=Salvia splendens TaxID=180675 RepID=A0A8X8VUH9_SALSN|nr:hypothetical protein SASPL_157706 [Salvia splendens]